MDRCDFLPGDQHYVLSAQNNKDGVPSIFGKSLITIQTASMEPTFRVGDLVFMEKLDDAGKAALQAGDIITYRAPMDINGDGFTGDLNTHRIVSIDPDTGIITTKGDYAGSVNDHYTITANDIIGKCTASGRIGGVGHVINFLQTSLGFFLCIVLPMLLFFIYELYTVVTLVMAERAKKAPLDKETEDEIKRKAIEEYLQQQEALAAEKAEEAQEPQEQAIRSRAIDL